MTGTWALAALAWMGLSLPAGGDDLPTRMDWKPLPPLPDKEGFAGMYAGVSGGALVAAGGANFPDGYPWQGGKKVWHDHLFVLEKPEGPWRKLDRKLPRPLAYGISATWNDRMLVVGGETGIECRAEVLSLRWTGQDMEIEELPPLPRPAANLCGTLVGSTLYVAGGIGSPGAAEALRAFWALDLGVSRERLRWVELEAWPGPARMLAVAAAQDGGFFVVGGADLSAGADGRPVRRYLSDAYRFTPGGGWKRIADLPAPVVAAPSPAPSFGQSHFVVIGGDDGTKAGFQPLENHPGFPGRMLAFHTVTGTWTEVGPAPAPRVTSPVALWRGRWAVPSGEQRPGVRSPEVWSLGAGSAKAGFGWVNYATLGLYPLVMLAVTWWVGRKGSSDEFFRGGQRIPWWAAGLSIYATMLSSITFMAIPAKAFTTDWSFSLANISILLLAPLVIAIYIPFFRRLDVTSAYEYLEKRFNLAARWFGSASFIALQIGRTAIVLYLPALALSTVCHFDMEICILVLGAICVLMTFQGGLESAIWTDVAQSALLLAGALITLVVAVWHVPGGVGEVCRIAQEDGKFFSTLRWTPELTAATGWVILFGNIFSSLTSYTAGQDVVQRYLSTKDARQAARAVWMNAILSIPSTALFFAVGTALYAFYKVSPHRLDLTLKNDAILPQFIVSELPAGLGGLVVAGIFAAAQPTSSLNSIATAWVADFHSRLRPAISDADRLRVGRIVTALSGAIGTAVALLMTRFDVVSLWDAFLAMLGLTGSALAGLFALGLFTRRAHGAGALVGAAAAVAVLAGVKFGTNLHLFTYGAIGFGVVMGVGYFASLVLPGAGKDLAGLTVHTQRDD